MGKSWRLEETKETGETTDTNGNAHLRERDSWRLGRLMEIHKKNSWRLEETKETGETTETNGDTQRCKKTVGDSWRQLETEGD